IYERPSLRPCRFTARDVGQTQQDQDSQSRPSIEPPDREHRGRLWVGRSLEVSLTPSQIQSQRFVARLPLRDKARKSDFDLLPRRFGHEPLELVARLTVLADASSLAGPGAASGKARLEHVVARETKDLEIRFGVASALQDRYAMVHLQHALSRCRSAYLARAAAGFDERAPATVGQELDACLSIVGGAHAVADRAPADVGCTTVLAFGRARAAQDDQVVSGRLLFRIALEDVERPAPLEPTALAGAVAPPFEQNTNARSQSNG